MGFANMGGLLDAVLDLLKIGLVYLIFYGPKWDMKDSRYSTMAYLSLPLRVSS